MVTQQILVLFFLVRIRVSQLLLKASFGMELKEASSFIKGPD